MIGPDDTLNASINCVIVGGESGPGARPFDLAWARSISEQRRTAGVSVFAEQLRSNPIMEPSPITWPITDRAGCDMADWPEELRIQQFAELRR